MVARIASGFASTSTALKTACLTESRSATASMIISALAIALPSGSAVSRSNADLIFSSIFNRRSNNFPARVTASWTASAFISLKLV